MCYCIFVTLSKVVVTFESVDKTLRKKPESVRLNLLESHGTQTTSKCPHDGLPRALVRQPGCLCARSEEDAGSPCCRGVSRTGTCRSPGTEV